MTTFLISQMLAQRREGKEPWPGRVILDTAPHGSVLGSVSAEAITKIVMTEDGPKEVIVKSAWRIAREKVKESDYYRIEGEGWFPMKEAA